MGAVVGFDLDRDVADVELAGQLGAGVGQELVVGGVKRADDMCGQGGLGRAHRPDVQIMHFTDTGQRREITAHADRIDVFLQTGTSYAWNSLLNGQDADRLVVMNIAFGQSVIPVFYDKDNFHKDRGEGKEVNFLYADGHINKLLEMGGTK